MNDAHGDLNSDCINRALEGNVSVIRIEIALGLSRNSHHLSRRSRRVLPMFLWHTTCDLVTKRPDRRRLDVGCRFVQQHCIYKWRQPSRWMN